jgi:hypothetical protein
LSILVKLLLANANAKISIVRHAPGLPGTHPQTKTSWPLAPDALPETPGSGAVCQPGWLVALARRVVQAQQAANPPRHGSLILKNPTSRIGIGSISNFSICYLLSNRLFCRNEQFQ